MLSGIGDAEYLQSLDIPVVVDLPNVGQNLQDHLMVSVAYQSIQELQPALSSNIAEAGLFLCIENDLYATPDLQFYSAPVLWTPPAYARSGSGFAIAPSLSHPKNCGSVSLRSKNPIDSPIIRMNYLENESDKLALLAGLKIARELISSTVFDDFRGEEVAPGMTVKSDEALLTYITEVCDTVYHPVGTCKMGVNSDAVVDPELRVHGIDRLRVIDASIMPNITTGNTNAPTIMIAEKGADLIKAFRNTK